MKTTLLALLWSFTGIAHTPPSQLASKPVLADLRLLQSQKIPVTYADENENVGFTYLTPAMEIKLHQASHAAGRCGSYESLEREDRLEVNKVKEIISSLTQQRLKNEKYINSAPLQMKSWSEKIQNVVDQVSETEIRNWVTWISSFPTRYNKGSQPNAHVSALYEKLENFIQIAPYKTEISLISHRSTPQKTIRIRIPGSTHPNEVVVLGGHFDSIAGWQGSGSAAPGADDNASGSANLLETLRLVLNQPQPQRTLEFFWYAGEESGLLGSSEIAQDYKSKNINVVAVLQLDMTLMPGEGELVIGNIQDFTSAWLRDYLVHINNLYIKAKLVSDSCGYGCSDHASWYRQGYPTLLPFEATTETMNRNIHTAKDVIDTRSNFKHASAFSKIAVVFALDLGNSTLRQP